MTHSPSPEEIKCARLSAGLSVAEAAAFATTSASRWRKWEAGSDKMHPGQWELFRLRVAGVECPYCGEQVTIGGRAKRVSSPQAPEKYPQELLGAILALAVEHPEKSFTTATRLLQERGIDTTLEIVRGIYRNQGIASPASRLMLQQLVQNGVKMPDALTRIKARPLR